MLVLVEDKVKTIREAYRVIKKGGRERRSPMFFVLIV
jgi:ubiquinone/menaquinone biosynthesis C-methylase UbiE